MSYCTDEVVNAVEFNDSYTEGNYRKFNVVRGGGGKGGALGVIILQSRKGDQFNFIDTTKILRPPLPPLPGDKK